MSKKIAIVFGGSRGIGAAIARALADDGADVAIIDIDGDRAREVAAEVGAAVEVADVTDSEALTTAAKLVVGPEGEIRRRIFEGDEPGQEGRVTISPARTSTHPTIGFG